MRILFLIGLAQFLAISSFGWGVNGELRMRKDLPCLSSDGFPISETDASKCCDGYGGPASNAPPECRVGFNSSLDGAVKNLNNTISLAQKTLAVIEASKGEAANLSGTLADKASKGSGDPDSNAMTARTSSNPEGSISSSLGDTLKKLNPFASSGGGSGGGAPAAGGSGGGLGGDKKSSNPSSAAAGNTAKDGNSGSYAGNGASGNKANGGDGKVSADGFGDERFSGANGTGDLASNGQMGDEDGTGSPNDDPRYFSLIDKSANLFKIVSNRYSRKKSLFESSATNTVHGIVPTIKRK